MQETEKFITYFKNMMARQTPHLAEYKKGYLLSCLLKDAMNNGFFSQSEFDEFLAEMENIDPPGHAYFLLWRRSVAMAYEYGLIVPNIWCEPIKPFGKKIKIERRYMQKGAENKDGVKDD